MTCDISKIQEHIDETQNLIKQDLQKQSNLKLEIAGFFGRSINFFSAL
jgi:hypothetical protein